MARSERLILDLVGVGHWELDPGAVDLVASDDHRQIVQGRARVEDCLDQRRRQTRVQDRATLHERFEPHAAFDDDDRTKSSLG